MEDLIEYCEKYPRLLTLRDSPLKYLQDPNVPKVIVHDWYIFAASEYIEKMAKQIIDTWENEYLNATDNLVKLGTFETVVDQLYGLYQRIFLAPTMPWHGDHSPMSLPELKERLHATFRNTINPFLSTSFSTLQQEYYTHTYTTVFAKYDPNSDLNDDSSNNNDYMDVDSPTAAPCTDGFPYRNDALTWILAHFLDENLPEVVLAGEMSNYLLERQLDDVMATCPRTMLTTENISPRSEQYHKEPTNAPSSSSSSSSHSTTFARFIDICQKCYALNLTPPWNRMIHTWILQRLENPRWVQNWTTRVLTIQLVWLQRTVFPWLSHILSSNASLSFVNLGTVPWYDFLRAKLNLEHTLYREYYQSRSKDIFDIIMDFPASKPVTEDLMATIEKTNRLGDLRDTIMDSLNTRLLHQGASAVDIIQQYISCIRLLKLVDPSCGSLLPIVRQIESYMTNYRQDTLSGVVEVIRQSDEYDLQGDGEYECYVFSSSELDDETSVILDESDQLEQLQRKSNDMVAMLINMCGSVSKFVEAYKENMTKPLLTAKDYDVDQEMINLELVKKHLPENSMTACDIMIRDMNDARRIDRKVHDSSSDIDDCFHATILSKHYWPKQKLEQNIRLPPAIEKSMEIYDDQYKSIKPSRKLIWVPSSGSITIELEFDGQSREFTVDPPSALVISLFEKDTPLTKQQVIQQTGLQNSTVLASLKFWHKNKILKLASNGLYSLLEQ
ncbi:unnamed protein product [Absidia cylindrospora]